MRNLILKHVFSEEKLVKISESLDLQIPPVGNLQSSILISCHSRDNNEASLDFLKKILASVQIENMESYSIAFMNQKEVISFARLNKKKTIRHVLSFGIKPSQLSLNTSIEPFQEFHLLGTTYIFCDRLALISKSVEKKKLLWNALKRMFNTQNL